MKRETLRHPKTYQLAALLGVSRPMALGYLTLLWDHVGEVSPQGDVGKWADGAIAMACDWTDDAEQFVAALVESRWLDRHDEHRLIVHDWPDHCERWVKGKLERNGLEFIAAYTQCAHAEDDSAGHAPQESPSGAHGERTGAHTPCALSNPIQSNPIQSEPNHAAARTARAEPDPAAGVRDESVRDEFRDWLAYKAGRKESLKPASLRKAVTRVNNLTEQHGAEAVVEAMEVAQASGWKGFEHTLNDRARNARGSPSDPRDAASVNRQAKEILRSERP